MKYYTPSIEEFHVGFEYETPTKDNTLYSVDSGIWEVNKVSNRCNLDLLQTYIRYGARVKCLDSDDIESLGFKLVWNEYGENIFEKDKYRIFHTTRWEKDKVTILDKVDDETPFTDCPVLFTGEIKNKSELKRTLKQIGYES